MKKYPLIFSFFFLPAVVFYKGCGSDSIPSLSKKEILVQKTWMVDELYQTISGKNTFYLRGGINTTGTNYDRLRFVFRKDGTGNTTQENGDIYPFIWKLAPDERSLSLTVRYNSDVNYSWKLLEIAGKYLHATVPLRINGDPNNVESFRLIQIDKE